MPQSINLIPQEERKEQVQQELLKASTVFTVVIVLVVGAIAGYYFYKSTTLNTQIKNYDGQIESARTQINSQKDIEIVARDLDLRKSSLVSLIESRNNYSLLMEELQRRLPSTVIIKDFNIAPAGNITVSGTATDYLAIAGYINNLNDKSYLNSPDNLKELFSKVTLNSVSLNEAASTVEFFITVQVNSDLLRKQL